MQSCQIMDFWKLEPSLWLLIDATAPVRRVHSPNAMFELVAFNGQE